KSHGFFVVSTTCSYCKGNGKVIIHSCETCDGRGKERVKKNLSVKIPAGIEDGTRLRLQREGEDGERGGPSGDLYVDIQVKPHPLFQRIGNDIYCKIPVAFPTVVLGGKIEVPTLNGKEKLEIPEGTQSGTRFSIKGAGICDVYGGKKGNEIIEIVVEVPKKLTKKQKEILKEFAKSTEEKKGNRFW
ncbi:MAG: DnaJ C-terminal domain-containing protein, partial [Thermodesulfobacteriota bacterium]|nr:DnaJ C-terminal domain-containing protein [Thermodesulfobacteriota bacterium]